MISEDITYGVTANISYLSELIPPAFLRKQEGGINSQTLIEIKMIDAITYVVLLELRKLSAH
jgi:hypothetical protein